MSCASPSSHSSTISTTISATLLPTHEQQQNSSRNGQMNSRGMLERQQQHQQRSGSSSRNSSRCTLTVREVAKGTAGGSDDGGNGTRGRQRTQKADTVLPPPAYGNGQILPPSAAVPCCWSSSSSSSPNSLAGLGKRRSSWSNLVQQSSAEHFSSPSNLSPFVSHCSPLPLFVCHAQFPSAPAAFSNSRPPSYGEFVTQCQNIRHSHTTASRQTSDASTSGRRSGGAEAATVKSKCASSAFLRFVGPPAPFPASAQNSTTVGDRVFSSSSGLARPLQSQNSPEGPKNSANKPQKKRDRMQELRDLWAKTGCKLCCLALLVTLIGLLVAIAVFTETFVAPKRVDFAWLPPDQFRSGGQPNRVAMRVGELGEQVRFELTGAPPFKSNIVTVFDFKTNNVAHLDRSLRSASSARQSVCFVLALDRQQTPAMDQLQRAAKASAEKNGQLHGWEEDWHFMPNPVSATPAQLFQPEISECQGARWIELIRTPTDQKGQRCSECFDFCLPDWGIERDAIRGEHNLNVVRRICFHLFVPEWRTFAQSFSTQQNQQDFEEFYRQQQQQMENAGQQVGAVHGGGTTEPKWVTLQTPQNPQHLANVSALFPSLWSGLGQVGLGIGQFGHGVGQHLFGTAGAPMASAQGQQSDNSAPQLTVHSQFSPALLNGPRQTSQQQQSPSVASFWNGWTNGATPADGTASVDGTGGGVGAVMGGQPGAQTQQQQNQPNGQQKLANGEQRHQQNTQSSSRSSAPFVQIQPQQQQEWVGKR